MLSVNIRVGHPDEQATLVQIQQRASLALEDYRDQLLGAPDAFELPIHQLERGDVFVAEMEGSPIGYSALEMDAAGAALDGLFVEPVHWRKGVGKQLVNRAALEARARGFALTVIANPTAVDFYECCGFQAEETVRTRFVPAVKMTL